MISTKWTLKVRTHFLLNPPHRPCFLQSPNIPIKPTLASHPKRAITITSPPPSPSAPPPLEPPTPSTTPPPHTPPTNPPTTSAPTNLSPSTDTFQRALANNKAWVDHTCTHNADLFPKLSKGQAPKILWIGCSDSRIPETTILGLQPGDVFVHRNIANILHPGDLNAAAVIEYAVAHIKVDHVVVCGHTSCGGVNAALGNKKIGVIDTWLLPLRQLRARVAGEMEGMGPDEKVTRLVEENVRMGVGVVKANPNVIEAVKERGIKVHGCVYDIKTGLLRELEIPLDEKEEKKLREACETS